jgi:hypothetical protein
VYTRGRCDFVFQERYSINKLDDEDAYTGVEVEAPVKVGSNMLTKTYNVKTLLPQLLSMTVKTVKHLIICQILVGNIAKQIERNYGW